MSTLIELPPDVLYTIVALLDIKNAVSLSKVSRIFRNLSQDRHYWLLVLSKDSGVQPLPVAPYTNLSVLDDTVLKKIALLAAHVQERFHQTRLQLTGSLTSRPSWGPDLPALAYIPGMQYVVEWFKYSSTLDCIEIKSGHTICSAKIEGRLSRGCITPFFQPGRCFADVLIDNIINQTFGAVILEYGPNQSPTLSFHRTELDCISRYGRACMDPELVAEISYKAEVWVVIRNLFTNASTAVRTNLPVDFFSFVSARTFNDGKEIKAVIFNRNVFVFHGSDVGKRRVTIHCVLEAELPYAKNPNAPSEISSQCYDPDKCYVVEAIAYGDNLVIPEDLENVYFSSISGVLSAVYHAKVEDNPRWSGFVVASWCLPKHPENCDSMLSVKPDYVGVIDCGYQGDLYLIKHPIACSVWGTAIALLNKGASDATRLKLELHLLHWVEPGQVQTSVHDLVVDDGNGYLDLRDAADFIVDEGVGRVTLSFNNGTMVYFK